MLRPVGRRASSLSIRARSPLALCIAVAVFAAAAATKPWTAHADPYACTEYLANTPTWTWGYTGYSYTNRSQWNAQYAYDASRFDSGGFATWSQHSNGGTVNFDNGTYAPYRKTGIYNNGTAQSAYAGQWNDWGSC